MKNALTLCSPAMLARSVASGGGGGGGLTIEATDTDVATAEDPATCTLTLTATAGARLVVSTANNGDSGAVANASISDTSSLTWTKRADAHATSSGNAEIWDATFSAGGSITVTVTWDSAFPPDYASAVLYSITGQETTPGGASQTATAQSAPSVSITTTRDGSIVFVATSDWNPDTTAGYTYRNSPTEDLVDGQLSPAIYRGWMYHYSAPTAGSLTVGLSAPTGMAAGTAAYEVRVP